MVAGFFSRGLSPSDQRHIKTRLVHAESHAGLARKSQIRHGVFV
jgi:hypothetical protein